MVQTIQAEQSIFLFGTGHSHMLAEEGHFRAGSLAAFVPILLSSIMLHEQAQLSGKIERTGGIAAPMLDRYGPQPGDMLFIFSNSGVNLMPVEMAMAAKTRGMSVASVSSFAYAEVAPLSSIGKRLHEVADFAIDNRIVPGDALVAIEGLPWKVGPGSTIAGSFILNCLVAEVAYRLCEDEQSVPLYASLNMNGAAEHNQTMLKHWGSRNPHL
jgi:uncharacterized phosphosugar-binding protein